MSISFNVPRSSRLLPIIGTVFSVVLLIIGGGFVAASQVDYSSYTESTTAVVVDVVREETSSSTRDDPKYRTVVYVSYTAEGQDFPRERLSGSWSGRPKVGDTFVLVYPPGSPQDAVTESVLDPSYGRTMLLIGVGLLVVGAAIGVLVTVSLVRRRNRNSPRFTGRGV